MKKIVSLSSLCLIVAATVSIHTAWAQMPGPGSMPGNGALNSLTTIYQKLSFTSMAVITLEGVLPKPLEMSFAMHEGKGRVEMDMTKMMADQGMPGGIPGFDKMVIITRPDKKIVYQVIPGLKGYVEMPIPSTQDTDGDKVERTVLGDESVDGRACQKVKVAVAGKDGQKTDITLWEAKDLGGIPVKAQAQTAQGLVNMQFKNIKAGNPGAATFDVPAGLTQYTSFQELMMGAMMQKMGAK